MVLRSAMHDLPLWRDHEQEVEEPVVDHFGPTGLALNDDVCRVPARQRGEPLRLRPRYIDEELACGGDLSYVEDLVGEAGEGAPSQQDESNRPVDADDRDGCMYPALDNLQVALDVPAAADSVDDGRQTDRHVGRDGLGLVQHLHCVRVS